MEKKDISKITGRKTLRIPGHRLAVRYIQVNGEWIVDPRRPAYYSVSVEEFAERMRIAELESYEVTTA